MDKKKRSVSRMRVIISVLSLATIALLTILILPDLYCLVIYFSVPDVRELTQSDSIRPIVINDRDDDLCIETNIPPNAIKPLRVKMIVNGNIVPYWKLDIFYMPPDAFMGGLVGSDVVCVDPQLEAGIHSLQVIVQPLLFIAYTRHLEFQITDDGLMKYSQ